MTCTCLNLTADTLDLVHQLHVEGNEGGHLRACPSYVEPKILTHDDLWHRVLNHISFRPSCVDMGWEWETTEVLANGSHEIKGWLVRVSFQRPDTDTGIMGRGYGRWELVEVGTTVSGAVKTAWLLCELIVRHELMEAFCFDGARVFDPHKSVGLLTANPRPEPPKKVCDCGCVSRGGEHCLRKCKCMGCGIVRCGGG